MTIFRDRLASAIRIKRHFVASKKRVEDVRNGVVAAVMLLLLVILSAVVFKWLET